MDHIIESQRQIWLKEQLALAKKVKVLPDKDAKTGGSTKSSTCISTQPHENDDFLLLSTNALLEKQQQDDDNKQSKNNPSSSFYYYGGVDVSFPNDPDNEESVAVYVIVDARTMEVVYQDHEYFRITVPYISSFLAFREIDPLQRLIEKQMQSCQPEFTPRAILVDGNGIFHERRAGLACFVGVRTGIPTIGVGKTLYCRGGLTENLVRQGIDLSLQRAVNHLASSLPKTLENPTTVTDSGSITTETMIIWDCKPITGSKEDVNTTADEVSSEKRGDMIRSLPASYLGLAIPLEARVGKDGNDHATAEGSSNPMHSPSFRGVLASVLIGHGGRGSQNRGIKSPGTKVPIFVSVGHDISLQEAVKISAFLSIYKLPEPVRQADLIGRELLRQRKQK